MARVLICAIASRPGHYIVLSNEANFSMNEYVRIFLRGPIGSNSAVAQDIPDGVPPMPHICERDALRVYTCSRVL